MALTPSSMMPLGTKAPDFRLPSPVSGGAYGAECTPDFFVFDAGLGCVYRGQLDDSRPGNGKPVTGADLRRALDSILNGETVPEEQVPSIGCNIKWK